MRKYVKKKKRTKTSEKDLNDTEISNLSDKKFKWSEICRVMSDSVTTWAIAYQAPLSIEFSRPEYWSELPFRFPGDLPNPGIRPRSPTLQEDSLPAEPSGKPKNPGVGSLSLLHWIFLTQESNWSLLHCRLILYQLRYQASPRMKSRNLFFKTLLVSSFPVRGLGGK